MSLAQIVKVTSNDSVELIYLPKAIREALDLRKGCYVVMRVRGKSLVLEKIHI